jgi:hypothetical protein
MNREVLKSLAKERRNPAEPVPVPTARKVQWVCEYCQHPFASERVFMKHHCRERERLDQLKSPLGQAAYSYYSEWMKLKRRSVPPIETFAESSYYTTFIKFATHTLRVKLPNPAGFIRTMVENGDVMPSLWCRDNVYAMYLQGYDKVVSPRDQFVNSFEELLQLAKEYEVANWKIFETLGIPKLLDLLQKRKISSWFLIASPAFHTYMNSQTPDNKALLEEGVQVGAMVMRIQNDEEMMKLFIEFRHALKEMEL